MVNLYNIRAHGILLYCYLCCIINGNKDTIQMCLAQLAIYFLVMHVLHIQVCYVQILMASGLKVFSIHAINST